jgi:hypothetical protein
VDLDFVAERFFAERDPAFLVRDFVGAACGPLDLLSRDATRAASFPAALPIVVAAFTRTPSVFSAVDFFFAISSVIL